MNKLITALLLVFGAGYLMHMAWTGVIGSRTGVFARRADEPTLFWIGWSVIALFYAWLLYDGIGVVLPGIF